MDSSILMSHYKNVQEVIQEQLNTKSILGKNTKYILIGEGNGIMSRIILVEPDWTVDADHLPSKFVLKIPYCVHCQGLIRQMMGSNPMSKEQEAGLMMMLEAESHGVHNREVNMNTILEKWEKGETLLNSKIYFSKKFDSDNKSKGFIGMEYVENSVVRHLYVNVKPIELYPVLKSLAYFQAGTLQLNEEEKNSISGFDFAKLAGPALTEDGIKGILQQARLINLEKLDEKVKKIEEFGHGVVNFELACNLNKYVGINQPVLVHGDLWSTNILWKERNGKPIADKIIDYAVSRPRLVNIFETYIIQGIHMGNPAEDIVRLFVSTLSGADRQTHWKHLLNQFYIYFLEALQSEKAPYTLDQLKESYRCYFVTGGLALLPLFGPVTQGKLMMCSENEDKEGYKRVITEKMERLLDDIEKYHLLSRNVTKSYKKPVARN
ncbi:Protein CBG18622 [Caenorhabditis briggsae]|uniref:Protein CBG18622 n=1 Tax=Caenorhabditis briggsae TaxID=6238 RepID=A8XTQ8_CAEBR|nr:Protein CBG18622 [Caenorhabditis briggsae]CAP36034.2 Protein CBG18622 [Caenorhabditis briggsae]